MKTPTQPLLVRIAGQAVRITLDPGNLRLAGHCGEFDFQECEIRLDEGMADEARKSTAIHEIVHGLDLASGTKMIERGITAFSSFLFTFIRDNPDFMAWVSLMSVNFPDD